MSYSAYLLLLLDTSQARPAILRACIKSESHLSITVMGDEAYVGVLEVKGSSYQEAVDNMLRQLENPWWTWVRPLLEEQYK